MKKKLLKTLTCGLILLSFSSYNMIAKASELDNKPSLATNVGIEDEAFYYVLASNSGIKSRIWAQTQSYKLTNGNRSYLGTKTLGTNTSISMVIPTRIGNITIKHSFSKSGKFKTYKQNVTIKVTYKRYRKVDNAYVDTKTITSHTSYIDYVAI